jgi:hypothetical protein
MEWLVRDGSEGEGLPAATAEDETPEFQMGEDFDRPTLMRAGDRSGGTPRLRTGPLTRNCPARPLACPPVRRTRCCHRHVGSHVTAT